MVKAFEAAMTGDYRKPNFNSKINIGHLLIDTGIQRLLPFQFTLPAESFRYGFLSDQEAAILLAALLRTIYELRNSKSRTLPRKFLAVFDKIANNYGLGLYDSSVLVASTHCNTPATMVANFTKKLDAARRAFEHQYAS